MLVDDDWTQKPGQVQNVSGTSTPAFDSFDWIIRITRTQFMPAPNFDRFVLGAGDEEALVELKVQNRFFVCLRNLPEHLSCGEPPKDNISVAAAGYDDVFFWTIIKL